MELAHYLRYLYGLQGYKTFSYKTYKNSHDQHTFILNWFQMATTWLSHFNIIKVSLYWTVYVGNMFLGIKSV